MIIKDNNVQSPKVWLNGMFGWIKLVAGGLKLSEYKNCGTYVRYKIYMSGYEGRYVFESGRGDDEKEVIEYLESYNYGT